MRPVERQGRAGKTESERNHGERGGDAVRDVRQTIDPRGSVETQQQGVAGQKEGQDRARQCAGQPSREERESAGEGEQGESGQKRTPGRRHGVSPAPGGSAESARGTKR